MSTFDTSKNDAQATRVDPVKVSDFPFETYQQYEQELTDRCISFMKSSSGALVYRRMRVAEVFSYGCRDMKQSLEWQLGALQKSMDYKAQEKLIGHCLVKPGHGFASSRVFEGFGMSDDNVVMVDDETYLNLVAPSFIKLGNAFGGPVHHSCGNFSDKAQMLTEINGLRMADAAFTGETDPHPNPPEPFKQALRNSGIILNARMVGNPDTVKETTEKLWAEGMKMVAVTFSQSPEEQTQAYHSIHHICNHTV